MDAVIYLRTAYRTVHAADDLNVIARQEDACRRYCAEAGHTVVGVYQDAGASASRLNRNRPGLADAVATVTTGKAQRLVAYGPDRLSRDAEHFTDVVAAVRAAGGDIDFANGEQVDRYPLA
jgi:DNA invertase Pin-like site-specific DNA recombinase